MKLNYNNTTNYESLRILRITCKSNAKKLVEFVANSLFVVMFTKHEFPNKLRLITVPSKDTQAITVLFLFGVGSRYEEKQINGASHFIEHLMFKGTKKRPTTLDISKELDRVGAEYNAMTSKDYTGYYIKINHQKVGLAVDVLSDMLLNSKFVQAEIDRERGVIIEEINMYQDNPLMYIETLLEEEMFKGNPVSRDVAGPASVIRKITRKQLVDYKNHYYRPDNVVVVAAGKIDKGFMDLLEKKFVSKLRAQELECKKFQPFKMNQKEPRLKLKYKNTKQVQLDIGFPTFGLHDERKYALNLMSVILGGNMSSRLFTSVRERRGLCYFVRCYPNYYQDIGNIVIQSGLDPSRIEQAIKVILQELEKIKKSGVSDKELKNAKEFLRGKTILNLEDSSHLAEYFAKQELLGGEILTPDQKMKKFNVVTKAEIKTIANQIFQKQYLNLALIGPFKSAAKFNRIMRIYG